MEPHQRSRRTHGRPCRRQRRSNTRLFAAPGCRAEDGKQTTTGRVVNPAIKRQPGLKTRTSWKRGDDDRTDRPRPRAVITPAASRRLRFTAFRRSRRPDGRCQGIALFGTVGRTLVTAYPAGGVNVEGWGRALLAQRRRLHAGMLNRANTSSTCLSTPSGRLRLNWGSSNSSSPAGIGIPRRVRFTRYHRIPAFRRLVQEGIA